MQPEASIDVSRHDMHKQGKDGVLGEGNKKNGSRSALQDGNQRAREREKDNNSNGTDDTDDDYHERFVEWSAQERLMQGSCTKTTNLMDRNDPGILVVNRE